MWKNVQKQGSQKIKRIIRTRKKIKKEKKVELNLFLLSSSYEGVRSLNHFICKIGVHFVKMIPLPRWYSEGNLQYVFHKKVTHRDRRDMCLPAQTFNNFFVRVEISGQWFGHQWMISIAFNNGKLNANLNSFGYDKRGMVEIISKMNIQVS